MASSGAKTGAVSYSLPMQTETGEYVTDADGNVEKQETELTVSQRETGEFVVNCQQVIYVINMYDAPSGQHLLGTDGDGFDVLSRIMYGGRVSLMVGFVVVFSAPATSTTTPTPRPAPRRPWAARSATIERMCSDAQASHAASPRGRRRQDHHQHERGRHALVSPAAFWLR